MRADDSSDDGQIKDPQSDGRVFHLIPDEGMDTSDIMSGRAGRPVNPHQVANMMADHLRLDGESSSTSQMSDD